MTLLPDALAGHAAGLSIVPVTSDGTKTPATTWKTYQQQPATPEQLHTWFGPHTALGVITGTVSGNLEMIELEGRAVDEGFVEKLVAALRDHGYGHTWDALAAGWVEVTPSGGFHWFYRVNGPTRPNTRLVRRPATTTELTTNPQDKIKVLIETRGEGGFVVLHPSNGTAHTSGKPWLRIVGGPHQCPVISIDERDALYAIAQTLDQMPVIAPPERKVTGTQATGDRPGDDYNNRADWTDILIPHGWAHVSTLGKTRTWRRPGKDRNAGISATTGRNDGDNLFVFSTSTEFESEKPYSKFGAYTLLEHNGDWNTAAKTLRAQGYGKPLEPSRPVSGPLSPLTGLPLPEGSLATVTELKPRTRPGDGPRTLAHTDDGNAQALIEQYGHVIRYCPDRGAWLGWTGQRWTWQTPDGGSIREHVKTLARDLPDNDRGEAKHKKYTLSASGTTNTLRQAQTDPRIVVNISDLDAHPWELNTPGGIVNLTTGQLHPSNPEQLHTRMTTVTPDAEHDPSRWQAFLADTFRGDTTLISYLRRLVGYSAVGKVAAHILPFCHGSGGNGKGVFLESLMHVLGDYATTAPSGFLMKQLYGSHETEIARLAGARMVVCSEVNEDDQFDEAKVKQLTGGDTLTARFMRQDHFTFTPTHTLWLMGNHEPTVRSGGDSFWRRVRKIGFLHQVPAEQIVDDLQGILASGHGPALLQWIIQGAVDYHTLDSLNEPAGVMAATAEYAHDQDTVARFLEERCDVHLNHQVQIKISLVREAYEAWCRENGEHPVTAKAFGMGLARREIGVTRTNKSRFYTGVTLLGDGDEEQPW